MHIIFQWYLQEGGAGPMRSMLDGHTIIFIYIYLFYGNTCIWRYYTFWNLQLTIEFQILRNKCLLPTFKNELCFFYIIFLHFNILLKNSVHFLKLYLKARYNTSTSENKNTVIAFFNFFLCIRFLIKSYDYI